LAGVPHHVIQRGNRRECVFFSQGNRLAYLRLLRIHAERHAIQIVAYCLMPNHVHLILVPSREDGLHRAIGSVHGQYAQLINKLRDQKGHFWQGRFFSSPLDSDYFVNAVRYVELNPVRAGLVARAEDFSWSSAAAHCGIRGDPLVDSRPRSILFAGIADWSGWLAEGVAEDSIAVLRKHARQNLPCGSQQFVTQLEQAAGRSLQYRPAGREIDKQEKGDSHF
jgi:putative transposase